MMRSIAVVGFSPGADLFLPSAGSFSFGGRIAFNRWSPHGEKWLDILTASNGYALESTSGSHSVIEIVPSVRIGTSRSENQDVDVALQLGAGLFLLSISDVTVSGSDTDVQARTTVEITTAKGSRYETERTVYSGEGSSVTNSRLDRTFGGVGASKVVPGLQAGLAITIRRRLVLRPLISLAATDSETLYDYKNLWFSLSVGGVFGR